MKDYLIKQLKKLFLKVNAYSKHIEPEAIKVHNCLTFNYKAYNNYIVRHLEGRYSTFEKNYIKNICDEELFPYYYFYCKNEKLWQEIYNKVEYKERITEIINSQATLSIKDLLYSGPVSIFISSHNKIYVFKLTNNEEYDFAGSYKIKDILNYCYKIDTSDLNFENTLNTNISITFKNKDYLFLSTVSSFAAEKLHQKISNKNSSSNNMENSFQTKSNQIKKLNKLLHNKEICIQEYKTLCQKVRITQSTARKELWNKAFIQYIEG